MDIKERFYANLDLIREDYDKDAADWSKKRAENAKIAKSQAKSGQSLLARIDPNYRKEKEKEAKHYKKLSKKYAKKAVTGMDEEAEQLDELRGYRKKKLFGKDPLVAVANRAINRMKLPPHKGKLSPEEIKSNRKNRKVSQMAFDRMPD